MHLGHARRQGIGLTEGGVGFALNALLYSEVTMEEGIVQQSNFDTYPLLSFSEMPEVETIVVSSDEPPTGIGEPPVPALGPAVQVHSVVSKKKTSP